jgi:TrmH family RNA methyltransferase
MITSTHNQLIKDTIVLHEKSRERRQQKKFTIEGLREINLAVANGYVLDTLFVCEDFTGSSFPQAWHKIDVSRDVFSKLAMREHSDGLFAVASAKQHTLEKLRLSENPFIIIIEAVEKPGNLGAILRTADAANVDAVIVCDELCDIYNPNVIRSSIGCLFARQVVACTSEQCFYFLKSRNIAIYAAELQASKLYHQTDMANPCAIVMGTEARGLSDFWLKNADARIKIPMRGTIDSLNVSVSTAIITFEAMRQREIN